MEKVCPWCGPCGQPSDRGRLKNGTEPQVEMTRKLMPRRSAGRCAELMYATTVIYLFIEYAQCAAHGSMKLEISRQQVNKLHTIHASCY